MWISDGYPEIVQATPPAVPPTGVTTATVNGLNGPLPAELHGWNWGAFFLTWVWGIGNKVWLALLVFVPFVGFIMPFVLGAKGNELAWQQRPFPGGVEQFRAVQRAWTRWGVGAVILGVLLFVGLFIYGYQTGGLEVSTSVTKNGTTTATKTKGGITTTTVDGVVVTPIAAVQAELKDWFASHGSYPGGADPVPSIEKMGEAKVSSYSPTENGKDFKLCYDDPAEGHLCIDSTGQTLSN